MRYWSRGAVAVLRDGAAKREESQGSERSTRVQQGHESQETFNARSYPGTDSSQGSSLLGMDWESRGGRTGIL